MSDRLGAALFVLSAIIAATVIVSAQVEPPSPPSSTSTLLPGTTFQIHFVDVGTGDATIIDSGDREVIIDGGNSPERLLEYIERNRLVDGPIELVIVSHSDIDHWRGLNRLLGFDGKATHPPSVREFWEPGYNREGCTVSQSFKAFMDHVQMIPGILLRRPVEAAFPPSSVSRRVVPLTLDQFPGLRLSLLSAARQPVSATNDCAYRINNASIVMKAEMEGASFLFTGDANGKRRDEASPGTPIDVEASLLALEQDVPGTLKADVLKVSHHGSETASTQAFIDAVDPCYAIISASAQHHLPKESTVLRLANGDRTVLRTDRNLLGANDNVICGVGPNVPVTCNFESVFRDKTDPQDNLDRDADDDCSQRKKRDRSNPIAGATMTRTPTPWWHLLVGIGLIVLPIPIIATWLGRQDKGFDEILQRLGKTVATAEIDGKPLTRLQIQALINSRAKSKGVVAPPSPDYVLQQALALILGRIYPGSVAEDVEEWLTPRDPTFQRWKDMPDEAKASLLKALQDRMDASPPKRQSLFATFLVAAIGAATIFVVVMYSVSFATPADFFDAFSRSKPFDMHDFMTASRDEILGALVTATFGGGVAWAKARHQQGAAVTPHIRRRPRETSKRAAKQ